MQFLLVPGFALAVGGPPDPDPGQGGTGGPGAVTTPIDIYTISLAILAITFIIYFVKKYNKKLA